MKRRLCLPLVVAPLIAAPLAAQSVEQRQGIDSARAIYATLAPEAQQQSYEVLRRSSDPMARLRRGYLLLSIGERDSSSAALVLAADEFYEVTVRRPRWVYGWYGLGETKRKLASLRVREVRSAHQPAGTEWSWGAIIAYMK